MPNAESLARRSGREDAPRSIVMPVWARRLLIAALAVKVSFSLARVVVGPVRWLVPLDLAATFALVVGLGALLLALARTVHRRLLWRVRRKLTLSYVFIGFVPVLLIVIFFALAGVLVLLNVGSFLVHTGLHDLVGEARTVAATAAAAVSRGADPTEVASILRRSAAPLADRHPGVSLALVPLPGALSGAPAGVRRVGPWSHLDPPAVLPAWIGRSGFAGLLVYRGSHGEQVGLVVRAVALPASEAGTAVAVVADVPVDETVRDRIRRATAVEIGDVALGGPERGTADPAGRPRADVGWEVSCCATQPGVPSSGSVGWSLSWVAFVESIDWATGRPRPVSLGFRVNLLEMYERISGTSGPVGPFRSPGQLVLALLGVVGVLFLLIEAAALAVGFALARSITGSVHELFAGTQRVRRGEFSRPIRVTSHDQLGELAVSFNEMTRSLESLLQQAAEKKRLEEELRIARQIQESLLPPNPVELPGATTAAVCVPAREVGGDYYDFFPLGPRKLAIVVADVAGKGTSAALYMAELKGLLLGLSRIYESPKALLVELNELLADHLGPRSFITMIYAVLDLETGWLRFARAGHTPLVYLPGHGRDRARADLLVPGGLVLGLRLDGMAGRFEALLEEQSLPVRPGDLFVLYTDGLTEATNEAADLFGEERLCRTVEAYRQLPARELSDRILAEVAQFAGGAERHDDLTMVIVKVEGP